MNALPPGSPLPSLIQLVEAVATPVELLDRLHHRFGDCFTCYLLGQPPSIILSHPEDLKWLMEANLPVGEGNRVVHPLVGDHSIVLVNGDAHRRQRKLLIPPLHGERMREYAEAIAMISDRTLYEQPLNQPFEIRGVMQKITLEVMLQTIFGDTTSIRLVQLHHLLAELMERFVAPDILSMLYVPALRKTPVFQQIWDNFMRLRQRVDALIFAEIGDRRSSQHLTQDILSLLLQVRDENGQGFTDQELRDQLITLLIAGHETTATAITWTLYWLYQNPHTLAELQNELRTATDHPIAWTKLPYLTAVCKESLRIKPVAMFGFLRQLQEPVQFRQYKVPAGVQFAPCFYLLHQREDIYPNAQVFRPERFLEQEFSPYEYMPFGGGSRRCIGEAFAQFEMKIVLARMLKHYRFEMVQPRPVKPVRRGVTLAPGVNLQLIPVETVNKGATRLPVLT